MSKISIMHKKSALIAIFAVGIIALIGVTFAVNSDWTVFGNDFTFGECQIEYSEDFVSPTNWQPGESYDVEMKVKNKSSDSATAKVKYEEYWLAADGETRLNLEYGGARLALINLQNQSDWEYNSEDGWYYYKNTLAAGEETNSMFDSVQLNPLVDFGGTSSCLSSDSGMTCVTPDNSYSNASYHLVITVQTVCVNQ